jgi:cytochrome c oxidase assembly protein subunit 15
MAEAANRLPGDPGHRPSGAPGNAQDALRTMRKVKLPALRPMAWTSLIANIALVVTGAAVRLTDSGLGCPTWPKCTDGSYTTTSAMGGHGAIEFGNRLLGVALFVVTVVCFLSAWRQRPRRPRQVRLALLVLLSVPAQAVMGGITVLSNLNPWVVGLHFLLSMALIFVSYALWQSTKEGDSRPVFLIPAPLRLLARLTAVASAAVIVAGVIVTGSGPHSGDNGAKRNGLDPAAVAQAHADLVFLLLGLTGACYLALRAVNARAAARTALILFAIELSQGLIGFVQYFTHLPVALVAAHMLGASLVWAGTAALLLSIRRRPIVVELPADPVAPPVPATAS